MIRIRFAVLLLPALLMLHACDSTTQTHPDGDTAVEFTEDALSYCDVEPVCEGYENCPEMVAYFNAIAEASRCTDDAECVDSGIGCGCTCNLVINTHSDRTALRDAYNAKEQSSCSANGCACDCPPAAGFVCENGFCNWNYDERANCICDVHSECCDGCYGRRDASPCVMSEKTQNLSWNCCNRATGSCQADCSHLMLFHDSPNSGAYTGENYLLGFSESGENLLAFWTDSDNTPTFLDQFAVANGYPQPWLNFDMVATSGTLSDDRSLVALASATGHVRVFSISDSRQLFSKKTPYPPAALAFNPTNDWLAIGSVGVTVYRLSDGAELASFPVEGESFMDVTFSPDGSLLVATSQLVKQNGVFGVFMVWNTADWSLAHQEIIGTDYVAQARFSPDGASLATISSDGAIFIWQVSDWSQTRSDDLGSSGRTLAFSADGRFMAAAGDRTVIRIWEVATWKKRLSLKGIAGWSKRLIFSPDSSMIASHDHYNQVILWDTSALINE